MRPQLNIESETSSPLEPPPGPVGPENTQQDGLFFGRFGLRAGWGIAIFLVTVSVFYLASSYLALFATGQLHAHPHETIRFVPEFAMVADGVTFAGLCAVCWFLSRGERRPLGSYGIGSNHWKDIFSGALWGVIVMGALVTWLHHANVLIFDRRALHGGAIFIYGVRWLLAFLFVGLAEEYMFRGYLQFTLMRGLWSMAERVFPTNPRFVAFWMAATILSATFCFAHETNAGETHFGLGAVFLAGITFSYALWRTGSLWWGIGFHMTWDWAQSFLFGVADSGTISEGRLFVTHPSGNPLLSGGPDGPEGSIFVCVALLLTIVVLRLRKPGQQPLLDC